MTIKKTKDGQYECECGGIIEVRKVTKTVDGYLINGKCMKCEDFKIKKFKKKTI